MLQDLRIGVRMLLRSPGFSLAAELCLTLGIAATTSVFSWIEGILVRPFPKVVRQERMFAMTGADRNGRTDTSWPDFRDLQKNCKLVDAFIAETHWARNAQHRRPGGESHRERITAIRPSLDVNSDSTGSSTPSSV
jgi:hypothetical protein